MELKEIMTRNVEVIHPDASLQDAAEMMRSRDVGLLPVCDGDRLLGTVSDRDITVRATANGRDPKTTPVKDLMTKSVKYCFEGDDVKEAARIMKDSQIRRLMILKDAESKKLVGIVSLGDLATAVGDDKLSGQVLEKVSQPGNGKKK
jgi:CBS domain-containing protein